MKGMKSLKASSPVLISLLYGWRSKNISIYPGDGRNVMTLLNYVRNLDCCGLFKGSIVCCCVNGVVHGECAENAAEPGYKA